MRYTKHVNNNEKQRDEGMGGKYIRWRRASGLSRGQAWRVTSYAHTVVQKLFEMCVCTSVETEKL